MPDLLVSFAYSPADTLDFMRDFDYGDEPYQRELANWIVEEATEAIARGTKVWLYRNSADVIVGYGSLGQTNWRYPEASSKRVAVPVIPAVALRRQFWGQPATGNRDERYSSQIVADLLRRALAWPGDLPAVGLYVHPENVGAILLYERFEFRRFHTAYKDPINGMMYLGYVRALPRASR